MIRFGTADTKSTDMAWEMSLIKFSSWLMMHDSSLGVSVGTPNSNNCHVYACTKINVSFANGALASNSKTSTFDWLMLVPSG